MMAAMAAQTPRIKMGARSFSTALKLPAGGVSSPQQQTRAPICRRTLPLPPPPDRSAKQRWGVGK